MFSVCFYFLNLQCVIISSTIAGKFSQCFFNSIKRYSKKKKKKKCHQNPKPLQQRRNLALLQKILERRNLQRLMSSWKFVHFATCRSSRRTKDQKSERFLHPTAKPSSTNLRWSISGASSTSPRSSLSPKHSATRRS